MSVQEIETAITQLSHDEFWKLSDWVIEYRNRQSDKQIENDVPRVSRLDTLVSRAKEQNRQGLTRPL